MRLRVHWMFAALLVVAAAAGYFPEAMVLVGSLAAHEIAHLAVAWVLGMGVEELVITPFGGMARLDGALEADPQAETSVALAGPFQSFFLAGLALFLVGDQFFDQKLVQFAFQANANLAFFNLIPALPLDGGRAMRGLLAQRWGYRKVTVWMARIGMVCGAAMTAASLAIWRSGGPLTLTPLLGGIFLAISAPGEVEAATYRQFRQYLRKREQLRDRRVVASRQLVVVEGTRLGEVMEHLTARRYYTVLVVERNLHPIGTLYEAELMDAFERLGPRVAIEEILDT